MPGPLSTASKPFVLPYRLVQGVRVAESSGGSKTIEIQKTPKNRRVFSEKSFELT